MCGPPSGTRTPVGDSSRILRSPLPSSSICMHCSTERHLFVIVSQYLAEQPCPLITASALCSGVQHMRRLVICLTGT